MTIKCGHCKAGHEDIAGVRACAKEHFAAKLKVQIGTIVTLDDVLGADVNPDPKVLLKEWSDAQNAKSVLFTQQIDASKVETGTYIDDLSAVQAATKPVATVVVPEHRIKPNIINAAQSIAAGNAVLLSTQSIPVVQIPVATTPVVIKKGQDLDLGMYQVDGVVYKIKFNKTGSHKYAEKLLITTSQVWDTTMEGWKTQPKGKFVYAYGMMATLTSENKMDEAAAKAFHDSTKTKYGQQYGFCCVCGKLLTVKKSIDAGIGPVCAGKL